MHSSIITVSIAVPPTATQCQKPNLDASIGCKSSRGISISGGRVANTVGSSDGSHELMVWAKCGSTTSCAMSLVFVTIDGYRSTLPPKKEQFWGRVIMEVPIDRGYERCCCPHLICPDDRTAVKKKKDMSVIWATKNGSVYGVGLHRRIMSLGEWKYSANRQEEEESVRIRSR